MAEKIKIITYKDFSGGMNDTVPPDNMNDTEGIMFQNCFPSKRGGIEKRLGAKIINNPATGSSIIHIEEIVTSAGDSVLCRVEKFEDSYQINFLQKENFRYTSKPFEFGMNIAASLEIPELDASITESNNLASVYSKDRFYFFTNDSFKVIGEFDYFSHNSSLVANEGDLVIGDVVRIYADCDNANKGMTYQSLIEGVTDLGATDYSDITKWTDVSLALNFCSTIRDVVPTVDITNNLDMIKGCNILMYHPQTFKYIASGNRDNPSALYLSEPDNICFWKETNVLYPTTAEGPVKVVVNLYENILVGYTNGWMVLSGTILGEDMAWNPLPIPCGVAGRNSYAVTPNSLTILSNLGELYIVNPAILSNHTSVNDLVSDYSGNISVSRIEILLSQLDLSLDTIKIAYHKNRVFIAYNDGLEYGNEINNKVLVIDWERKSFSTITGWNVHCWMKSINGSLYFGTDNYIAKAFSGDNDFDKETGLSVPIHFKFISKAYDLGSFGSKLLQTFYITAQQFSTDKENMPLNVQVKSDYEYTGFDMNLAESFSWGRSWGKVWGWADVINQWAMVSKQAFRFQIILEDATLDNPIFIYLLGFEFMPIEFKGGSYIGSNNPLEGG